MIKNYLFFILPFILLQSCGTFLDVAGKGAKTNCLSMDTETQSIICNCGEKQISTITIFRNKDSKENFGKKIHHFILNPQVNSFTIPIPPDSLNQGFFQIEIHLTDSHWRESYYIDTKPGDFNRSQKIYSRYYSH